MKSFRFLLFLCSALLVGCQTTGSDTGSGRITLSPGVQVHFEKYLASPEAEFFAVSPDGQAASYSFCPEAPCTFGNGVVALRSCNARRVQNFRVRKNHCLAGGTVQKTLTKPEN
jgi:hypothetical protein